jgi:hypothetical protein
MKELNKLIFNNIKESFEPESIFHVVEKPFTEFKDFQLALFTRLWKPVQVEDKEDHIILSAPSLYSFKSEAGRIKRSVLYYHIISKLDFEANTNTITPTRLKTNAEYIYNKYWLNCNYKTKSGKLELTDLNTGEVTVIKEDSTDHLVLTESDINCLRESRQVYVDATLFSAIGDAKINNLVPDNKVIELKGDNKVIINYYGFVLGNGLIDESEHTDYTAIFATAELKDPEAITVYTLIPDEVI